MPTDPKTQAALTSARALCDLVWAATALEDDHGEKIRAARLDAWSLVKAKARETRAALDAAEKGEGARSLIAHAQRMFDALNRIAQCTPREIREKDLGYDSDDESEQDPVVIARACLFDMEHPPADALGAGEEGDGE